MPVLECSEGCLFDIWADPREAYEVSRKFPEVLSSMQQRIAVLNEHLYDPYRGSKAVNKAACEDMLTVGFYGPFASGPASNWISQSESGRAHIEWGHNSTRLAERGDSFECMETAAPIIQSYPSTTNVPTSKLISIPT